MRIKDRAEARRGEKEKNAQPCQNVNSLISLRAHTVIAEECSLLRKNGAGKFEPGLKVIITGASQPRRRGFKVKAKG